MSRIVVALGGNALGSNPKEQLEIVRKTVKNLVDLVEMGHELIITHGNGPQVGMIFNAMANVDPTTSLDDMPFAECGAMSQGYIGYHLQNALQNELMKRDIKKNVLVPEALFASSEPYLKTALQNLLGTENVVYKS